MANFPGEYELRVNYSCLLSGATRFHQLRHSLNMSTTADPGDPLSDWIYVSKDGSNLNTSTWLSNLVTKLRPNWGGTATFISCELWKYTPQSYDAAFQTVETIGLAGTAGAGNIVDGQTILTFRSQLGGSAKFDFRESIYAAGPTVAIASAATAIQEFADLVMDGTSPVVARDNGYLFDALNLLPGINERAFKRRNRFL